MFSRVGRSAIYHGHQPDGRWRPARHPSLGGHAMSQFMFATGIENSYPTIEWKGKRIRQDELAKTQHYRYWRKDFELLKELGIGHLRYGPPYFSVHKGAGEYDWDFLDETFRALR